MKADLVTDRQQKGKAKIKLNEWEQKGHATQTDYWKSGKKLLWRCRDLESSHTVSEATVSKDSYV
jgi:hypothetical protein